MHVQKYIKYLFAILALGTAQVAFAGFSTYTNNWPDDAETVNERITKADIKNQQQTPSSIDANACCVDATDQQDTASDDRMSEDKRLYAKLGMTFFTEEARNIQNTSPGTLSGAQIASNSASESSMSWEFALGTKLKYVRMELEYMYMKQISYNAQPLFVGTTTSIASTLSTQGLWLNVLYDLNKLNIPYFTPYIGGSAGFIWNQTNTTTYGGSISAAAKSHNRLCVGWGVTVGLRIPFWKRWFGYLGYKYADQGNARWQSYDGTVTLKAYPIAQGVDLGVMYLLG